MIRPLWAVAGVALLGVTGVAGALIVLSPGGEEEVVQQVETATPAPSDQACDPKATPPPGSKLWRWLNVTVVLPDEPGFEAFPGPLPPEIRPPEGGEALTLSQFDPSDPSDTSSWSSLTIDAETGATLSGDVLPEHQESMQRVEESVAVCPFDPTTAPWPYNGEPPQGQKREVGSAMSFLRPDPASGLYIDFQVGASGRRGGGTPTSCEVAGKVLGVRNWQSAAFVWVDSTSGALCKDLSHVAAADAATFERYLSDVKQCGKDVEC